jgi:hypothetical protein
MEPSSKEASPRTESLGKELAAMKEVVVIGKDVWWDNKKKIFRKKRLNFIRVPSKFRCPNCGKILTPSNHRDESPFLPERDIDIGFYGGVCQNCWLDGFGKYGKMGSFFASKLKGVLT